MRYGEFAKYKGKEFATADDCAGIVLLSGYISDIEEYGFKVCEPFDLMGFKRVVCVKVVNLSEVDEYYLIRAYAYYEGYKGRVRGPNKNNMVSISYLWGDIPREEAIRLGMEVGHGEYVKEIPLDEVDIFYEREDYDIKEIMKQDEEKK